MYNSIISAELGRAHRDELLRVAARRHRLPRASRRLTLPRPRPAAAVRWIRRPVVSR